MLSKHNGIKLVSIQKCCETHKYVEITQCTPIQ